MSKSNNYMSFGGITIADHNGMEVIYAPKVKVARQILNLSAATLSQTFGVVGASYIEGVRSAMIEELQETSFPVSSWRCIASRVLEASDQ